jgi:transcriptional regulator with XRE-family HTH domain
MMPFSQFLRNMRKMKDLTQEELSRACSQTTLHPSVVSRIESGHARASFEQMAAMIAALEMSWAQVLDMTDAAYSQNIVAAMDRPRTETWKPFAVASTAIAIGDVQLGEGVMLGHYTVLDATRGTITVADNVTIGHGSVVVTTANQIVMVERNLPPGSRL